MKLMFKAVCCAVVISMLLSVTGFCGACDDIQNEVFRLHIIANSDSQDDQKLKLYVRDGILEYTEELFKDCKNKEQSVQTARDNIDLIKNKAQSLVYEYGYDYPVDAYVTKMSFNTRIYNEFTLPAGQYEALRIVIGDGNGKNWWCVLYPALCVPSAEGNELNSVLNENEQDIVENSVNYQVKFKIVEVFEYIINALSIKN
ncbi:MAG: stage II sporulation protein R [Acutalibacteraceae bacterium]